MLEFSQTQKWNLIRRMKSIKLQLTSRDTMVCQIVYLSF